ncbi:DUF4249 domain-containing protein [Arundinibacter roseus]|uniref:DUF4249 domain-containing protein n=1 Tax=Arundinibacter roseus TaxID=2070510 RepID=A0A4R4JZH6_9BACT|nr:DUF4249 domain-containing protein [Arundinibacter roseus]TDB59556.1 DUF4249 domain-containing protein [Arundinibacter roseus]
MKNVLIAFMAGILLASCEMVSQKNVDLPPAVERLVMIGLATNQGIGVYVSRTVPLPITASRDELIEAQVQLVQSETSIARLHKNSQLYESDTALHFDSSYQLRVVHPTLGEASAPLEVIPGRIAIQAASLRGEASDGEASVSFMFSDPPGPNYYAYQFIPLKDGVPLTDINPYSFRVVLDDTNFEGKTRTVTDRMLKTFSLADGTRVFANGALIYLHHLTANTYRYHRSLQEYEGYSEDTFANPPPVLSNVRNGFGYLGVSYVDTVRVELVDK